MEGTTAVYLGRIVEKENFRVFVYSPDGKKRLVESWDAFESLMQTGLWFASKYEDKPEVKELEQDLVKPNDDVVEKDEHKQSLNTYASKNKGKTKTRG